MFTFGGDGQPHESSVIVQVRARVVLPPLSADVIYRRVAPRAEPIANVLRRRKSSESG